MAVANPCFEEWEEWKTEMEKNRRMRWRERVSRRAEVQVSDGAEEEEEGGVEEGAKETNSGDEEVSKDKEETEAGEMGEEGGEEVEMREAQEVDVGVGRRVTEIKNGDEADEEVGEEEGEKKIIKEDEEEDSDLNEVTETEEAQGKGDDEENKEVDADEEEGEVTEEEEEEEEREVENEVETDVKDNVEVEEGELVEAAEKEVLKDKQHEFARDDVGEEEEDGEEEEAEDTDNEKEEVSEDKETEGGGMGKEEEEDEMEMREAKDTEEEAENEVGRGVTGDEEADEEKEEHEEQEKIGQYYLAEQFREQMRRTEDENIQQHQRSTRREDRTVNEDEHLPKSEEFNAKDSTLMRSEDESYNIERLMNEERDDEEQYQHLEELENPREKYWRKENSITGAWTSQEEGDESEKLTDEEEKVAESWTTQDEQFQDELQDEEEEEDSTDYEGADEDVDNYEEEVVKIYCKDDYLTDLFSTLTKFRDTSLLTDLTLSTEDGKIFHVHSIVMAAVSFRIRESLCGSSAQNGSVDEKGGGGVRVHKWSMSLGPEVDHVGLEAVVEFSYTGLMSCLNKDTVHQIKAAAETLRAPRVLEHCTVKEEKFTTGGQRKDYRISAEEQMMISLQAIKQLWMDRVGCDFILDAIGGSLHVHRVILAVWSDYFRSMFTLGMRESHQPCVTFPFLLASEMEVLIDYSYSGALPLSWKCVFEITRTSLQLLYEPTLSLGLQFLQQEINPHSCLDVASFAEAYEMAQLLEVADDFVLRQFQKVACTSKFKDLPVNKLLRYLNSHSLYVSSELVVFKAVVAWIQAKPKERLKLAKELMKTIHFPLMTFREFKEVQSQNMWSDHSTAELFEEIYENFCEHETAPQSQCRIYLPKESLVLIGGDQTSEDLSSRSISRELWFGNSLRNHTGIKKAMEWRRLGEMPDAPRFSHEVAVLKGQLYVFGGKKYYGTDDTLNSVYRYDPLHDSWECLAAMQEKRFSFSVVVLDGKIYAIGGHCNPDYIETVEQYCPITNSWRFTCPLDLPQSGHVAKVLQGKIFVSGGMISDSYCLSSMFQYHPETGSTYLANMAKPRANHCMEVMGDCLYVAGGISMGDIINIVDQLSCEVYNPAANSWTAFTSLPVPHVGAGSAVLEGKFYILGGYSHEEYNDTKIVHCYNPNTQRWEHMGKTPGPNNDIRASLLCLPPHCRL